MFLRKFIILTKQSSENAKGHTKLEVRGTKARLSLSLEGAEIKEDTEYKLYFVANEENNFKELLLGKADVNKSGKGKLELSFNPKSINKSKIDIKDINIILLKQENLEDGHEQVVLGGYIHKEDGSIAEIVKEKIETKKITKKEIKTKLDTEEFTNIKTTEQVANYTLDILTDFEEIKPFKKPTDDQRWWQIERDKQNIQRGSLPYYNYILNPPCQKQIKEYNNYLFGVASDNDEITHYIYGIPGRNRESEHPYQGKTGFITWLEDSESTGNGYWLSYIDACTGNVVKPL